MNSTEPNFSTSSESTRASETRLAPSFRNLLVLLKDAFAEQTLEGLENDRAHVEGLLEHPLPRLRQRGVSSYPSMPASRGTERRRSRFEASAQGPRSLKAASSAGTPRSQRRECGCFDCIEAWPGSSKRPRRSFIHLHMKLCFANGKLHGPEATVSMDTSVPVASTRACGRDIASQREAVPPARRA